MPVFSGIMKATIEMVENEACGTIFDTTYSMKSPSCHKKRKAKEPNEVSPLSAVASTPTVASIEALRKNQRSLNQRIANDSRDTNNKKETAGEDDDDENQSHDEENSQAPPNQLEFLDDVRNENNKLFKEVKYTREAVLDAENVDLIANKYVNQVDRLVQVPRYDAVRLVQALRKRYCNGGSTASSTASSYFDWNALGKDTTYSMKSPSCHKKRKAKEPNEVSPLSAVARTPTVASIEASGNEVSPLSAVASTPTVASIEATGNEVSPLSAVASSPTSDSIEATGNEESLCGTCDSCRYANMVEIGFDMYKNSPEGQNSKDANRVLNKEDHMDVYAGKCACCYAGFGICVSKVLEKTLRAAVETNDDETAANNDTELMNYQRRVEAYNTAAEVMYGSGPIEPQTGKFSIHSCLVEWIRAQWPNENGEAYVGKMI